MSQIIVPYERDEDGARRWAVYSTVNESVVAYDHTASEIIEWRAQEAYRDEVRRTLEIMHGHLDDEAMRPYPETYESRVRDTVNESEIVNGSALI